MEQHIAWASRYGIDFFTVDYWPHRPEQNKRIDDTFLQARNIGDIKFAVMYESYDLSFVGWPSVIYFTNSVANKFYKDLLFLADKYFDHPSYLKVSGRPVIFLYLTRAFHGSYGAAIKRFRKRLQEDGIDPYIIGDEIFWRVLSVHTDIDIDQHNVTWPQLDRINLFDAITTYNLYDSGKLEYADYGSETSYVADSKKLYARYREAVDESVPLVPGITPGYNDRGVRAAEDYYALPRQWSKGDEEGSFFAQSFDQIGIPEIDPNLRMILITSWNEWNEDTSIEPVWPSPPTNLDISPTGDFYTQGYSYQGYGTKYLEIVRDKVVSVTGKVTDTTGEPVWGEAVCAYSGVNKVTCSPTNREGYYRLSRLKLPPAIYNVGPESREERTPVEVTAKVAAAGVDFIVER